MKNIILISALIVACIAITTVIRQHRSMKLMESQIISRDHAIQTYRNSHGKLITKTQAYEAELGQLRKTEPRLRELEREFNIKLKHLRGYIRAEIITNGSGNARIIPVETGELTIDTTEYLEIDMNSYLTLTAAPLPNKKGYYYLSQDDTIKIFLDKQGRPIFQYDPFALVAQDGYLDFHADIYNEYDIPFSYTYSDTLRYVFTNERDHWWSRKKLYGRAMLGNPAASVVHESFLVRECRDRRFGIGPYIGYGVSPQGLQWSWGLGVQYSLIRF